MIRLDLPGRELSPVEFATPRLSPALNNTLLTLGDIADASLTTRPLQLRPYLADWL